METSVTVNNTYLIPSQTQQKEQAKESITSVHAEINILIF